MKRRVVSGIALMLLLTSMLLSVFVIQPVKAEGGTIYIRADGSVDPPTAPIKRVGIFYIYYTFTDDIYDTVHVQRSDITIDGANYTLEGDGTGIGLYIAPLVGNITVKNMNIRGFEDGLYLKHSGNNKIIDSIITNNTRGGITLWGIYSSNNYIYNNTITDNWWGINAGVGWGSNNIFDNIIEDNEKGGLGVGHSGNNIFNNFIENNGIGLVLFGDRNVLRNNSMIDNDYNFGAGGINDIDTSNTVDSKPIYYWINEQNKMVPSDAGYVALVNCKNITVRNLEIKNNDQGILLNSTTNSKITQNTLIDNKYAIDCHGSSNNSITDNLVVGLTSMQAGCGISLNSYSSFNNISGNAIMQHQWSGMRLYDANNNYVYKNSIMGNKEGIWLKDSKNNVFYHNSFMNNQKEVVLKWTWGSLPNAWHIGYPDGGNFWDDYTGIDEFSGPNQDMPGSDGIGDIPYEIDGYYDLYPLMNLKPFRPMILLTSPIGGEEWLVGSHQPIRWISLGLTGNVSIELSTDSGANWQENLYPSTVNDGYEGWRVIAYPGNRLRIRVASLDYPAISDVSDSDFTISTVSATNTFPEGYCTWWAYERRAQLGMPISWLDEMPRPRDAWKWIDFAEQAGITTGLQPRVGAIAVWGTIPTNSFGHVAIVEWLGGGQQQGGDDSTFYISEMNFGSFVDPDQGITVNFKKVTDRTLPLPRPPEENFLGFIYGAAIPDFSITASPTSLTIQQGYSDTSVITMTSIGGFDQPVQLTVSVGPPGYPEITTTLDPEQVTPPPDGSTTSTLTVSVDTTAIPEGYYLNVTGTSGTLTHSVFISLEVTVVPPPELVSARIDSYSLSSRNVAVGYDVTIGFSFTNTGDVAWTFGAGATLRKPDGTRVDFLEVVTVNPGESGSAQWTYTIEMAGRWGTVFGVWKESTHPLENLLVQTGWVAEYITATVGVAGEWTFAIITDLHIGRGWHDYGADGYRDYYWNGTAHDGNEGGFNCLTDRLADVVKWINDNYEKNNIKFLVILGDITDSGEMSEFFRAKKILDGLEIPYIPVIGNHDVWSETKKLEAVAQGDLYFERVFSEEFFEQQFEKLGVTWWDKQDHTEQPFLQNYAFSYGGINFIGLDYARRDVKDASSWAEDFPETRTWLSDTMANRQEKTVIIFSHYPFMLEGGCSDKITADLGRAALKYGRNVLTFGGHIHYCDNRNFWLDNTVLWKYTVRVIVTKGMMGGMVKGETETGKDFLRIVNVGSPDEIDYSKIVTLENAADIPDGPAPQTYIIEKWHICRAPKLWSVLWSPGELRVYDSQGRVTGLMDGEVKNEISNSLYFDDCVVVLSANDSYRYEVIGTEEGSYTLQVMSITELETITFSAINITTSTKATHKYTIDWTALSQGEQGVTIKVDSDGDGTFEKTFTADAKLTRDEFMLHFAPVEAVPMWIIGVAVATIVLATVTVAVFWRRPKKPATKG